MEVTLRIIKNPLNQQHRAQFALNRFQNNENLQDSEQQTENSQFKKLTKIFAIVILFGSFLTYRCFFSSTVNKNCVIDNIHESTFGINRQLNIHGAIPFIGFGQVIMDVCVCASTLYWVLFLKNFRYPVVMAMFQYGRSIMLRIITMPFASYVLWFNPGFPSFSVFYEHTSDYFFSGHTGTLVILILESKKLKLPIWVKGYLIFGTIYIILMLLIGRVHYTIDVFGGLVYSWYFYKIVDRNLSFFDQILNAPYRLVDIVQEKVKRKLLQSDNQSTSLYDIQHP